MSTRFHDQPSASALQALPSVLAIRDLQRRWQRVFGDMRPRDEELTALLKLDPLTVLRGLRAANAPIFGPHAVPSVGGLVAALGVSTSLRLLDIEPINPAGTGALRDLWRHSIATAIAAEDLARDSGLVAPDTAYLLGLLHDLPLWLSLVAESAIMRGADVAGRVESLQLPSEVTEPLAAMRHTQGLGFQPPTDTASLLCEAERLAKLADFHHPRDSSQEVDLALLTTADRTDFLVAQRLRRRVEGALRTFGLDPSIPDTEMDLALAQVRLAGQRRGTVEAALLSIFSCSRSETYRGIVTALLATSIRFGDFDRAFYGRWTPGTGELMLRTKADSSARRLVAPRLHPNNRERHQLREALELERPTIVRSDGSDGPGLLRSMAADELLAIPLNREFASPAFLLVDRSLTLRGIDPEVDLAMATTIGMTGSLLIENLLLRRRRQRAHNSSMIDPLTRLHNRRMGLVQLEQEIARSRRSDRPLTVLMCDLDHFKRLNDDLGHIQGDAALRETAQVLRDTLRKGDTICRYGGEEFLVVLPETCSEDALVLATRLFTKVFSRGEELGLPISISVGLTTYREGDSTEDLLQRADRALYASKDFGRNGFSADLEGSPALL